MNIKRFSFLLVVLMLTSCSGDKTAEEAPRLSAEELYDKAQDDMAQKKYESAVENYQEIERQYPFSPLSTRAQVMAGYAYYRDQKYDDAIGVLERFTKMHPGNVDIAYAYYLRALCHYERIVDVRRDQNITKLALDALNDVIVKFPETEYARDARLKLDLVKDHLAGKEMEIGRFYQKRGQYIAAINRYKAVIKDFDTTSHVPEALYRLTEIYLTMGVNDEARRNASVLGHNFPDSKWYKYAYRLAAGGADSPLPKEKPGWIDSMFLEDEEESDMPKEEELPKNQNEEGWLDKINVFK